MNKAETEAYLYAKRKNDYLAAVKPYRDVIIKIYACSLPKLIIHENGKVERRYEFSEETQASLDYLRETIERIAAKYSESQPYFKDKP